MNKSRLSVMSPELYVLKQFDKIRNEIPGQGMVLNLMMYLSHYVTTYFNILEARLNYFWCSTGLSIGYVKYL